MNISDSFFELIRRVQKRSTGAQVYALYGLTPEEIAIVDGTAK